MMPRRLMAFAGGVSLMISSPLLAQTGGTATGGTASPATGTGFATGSGAGTSSGLGNAASTPAGLGQSASLDAAPTLSGISINDGARPPGALNQSNALGAYYANPYFQGRSGATAAENPGGFGQSLYGGAVGGRGVVTGAARTGAGAGSIPNTAALGGFGTTGFGGTGVGAAGGVRQAGLAGVGGVGGVGGFGGTGGLGGGSGLAGFGGASAFGRTGAGGGLGLGAAGATTGGQVVPLPRQIAYTSTIAFPVPGPSAQVSRLTTDVRGVIERSVVLSNPRGIDVAVAEGGTVVLRGNVRDQDEARLAEGMIRLTPGVREVQNQLTYPRNNP